MPYAVWTWTWHGEDEGLTAIFEPEGEAAWYRDRLEVDRRLIHPQRGEHRAAGAAVEPDDPAVRVGERRPRKADRP